MKGYFDIEGDGGSDVAGQVTAQQRAIAEALSGVRHVVGVGSGKGGVGKSTVTMGLAWALARAGRRVTVLDVDFNGPCQAQLAGLAGRPWVPGERGLAVPRRDDGVGVVSFGSVLEAARPMELASVARGDEHVWRATREFAILGQLLAGVDWGELDVLLLDLPPGAERTRHLVHFLDGLRRDPRPAYVLVTIPSELARGVVARSVAAVEGARLLGLIENMAGYVCEGCDAVRPLFPRGAAGLDGPALPTLGSVPFDPRVAALCDAGWPSADAARLASPALTALAAAAERVLAAVEAPVTARAPADLVPVETAP